MAKFHDKLKDIGYDGHNLEVYLVRLLFCLFADDTGIFDKDLFLMFLINKTSSDGSDLSSKLQHLFQILNTPKNKRLKTLDETLNEFPYVNGKLFEETLMIPSFDRDMKSTLLNLCRLDWAKVSPAVFGSLFQSVMDTKERRNLGAHFTSEKDILKLINSLFMDELWEKFKKIKNFSENIRENRLNEFRYEISQLKFFDPACGCGNFLIIAYRELRKLENEILRILYSKDGDILQVWNLQDLSKIRIDSFYGIEIKEFSGRIAEVSMWMMDHLMNNELSNTLGHYFIRLPLSKPANILIDNALRLDWNEFVTPDDNVYILGNPPFGGKQLQSSEQKEDMKLVFDGVKSSGNLDYVTAWYIKSAQYIQNTNVQVAFVSTNSISQGEQVSILWQEMYDKYKVNINFAHRTFKWQSEGRNSAKVFVVIIGFSQIDKKDKFIFDYEKPNSEPHKIKVKIINPYLIENDVKFILSRRKPICKSSPPIAFGNMPNDGGNLLLNENEKNRLINEEPDAIDYIKPFIAAKEYLNGINRYCLWLKDITPSKLNHLPKVLERVSAVKEKRLKSSRKTTLKLANIPYLFGEIRQPDSDYIVIPIHSSENRDYIPLSFFNKNHIIGNSCISVFEANLYHFGILMSEIHMIWVKYICGRIKGDYRYSINIVYNNFPWPKPNETKIKNIKKASKELLVIRDEMLKDNSLADLYNPLTMPNKLRKGHRKLDKYVYKAYGKTFKNEMEIINFLFELYGKYQKST